MDCISQMAESYGLKKTWFSDQAHFICYNASYAFEISVCDGYSVEFSCNDDKLWEQVLREYKNVERILRANQTRRKKTV